MSRQHYGPPYSYLQYNRATALYDPSTVHVSDSGLSYFFQRYLFQRLTSVFKWTMPDTWNRDYFLGVLYSAGFISVFNTRRYGVIPQAGVLSGYDVFYAPTTITIANPLLPGLRPLRIDKDCVVIKLAPDYVGVYDLVSYYADQMALAAQALGVNLLNSKLSYIFIAGNKAGAETMKGLYDKVASGQPAVFYDSKLKAADGSKPWEFFSNDLRANFITPEILETMQTILDMFDAEVGIPNVNHRKGERMVVDEVNSNNVATLSKATLWLETMRKGVEQVREWWGLDLSVDWNFLEAAHVAAGVAQQGGDGNGVALPDGTV